eukprot:TRINITY_DN6881_c0_g1_i7.p1 TRINITY_DN6881_c0_g1~~TRINITY_DN6881_c0_g1_i7.p1  ORF type:complete len:290 (-),score=38.09 TRINITY_DN6881_c0_g1_i7:184-1053(-)
MNQFIGIMQIYDYLAVIFSNASLQFRNQQSNFSKLFLRDNYEIIQRIYLEQFFAFIGRQNSFICFNWVILHIKKKHQYRKASQQNFYLNNRKPNSQLLTINNCVQATYPFWSKLVMNQQKKITKMSLQVTIFLISQIFLTLLLAPEWQEFANNFLTPMNEKYNRFIGGQKNSGEYEDMQDLYMLQKAKEFNIVDNEIELFEQQQKNKSKEVEVIQQVPNQQNQQSLSTDIFNSFDQAFDFTAQPSQPVKVTDFDQFGFVSSQDKTNDESSNNQSNPFDQFQDFSFNQTK